MEEWVCAIDYSKDLPGGQPPPSISLHPNLRAALRRRSSFGFDEDDEVDETVRAVVSRQEEPSRIGGL
jgi:hypothetical protein